MKAKITLYFAWLLLLGFLLAAASVSAHYRQTDEDTKRFILAGEGLIRPEEFFNTENLQRISSRADFTVAAGGRAMFVLNAKSVFTESLPQSTMNVLTSIVYKLHLIAPLPLRLIGRRFTSVPRGQGLAIPSVTARQS